MFLILYPLYLYGKGFRRQDGCQRIFDSHLFFIQFLCESESPIFNLNGRIFSRNYYFLNLTTLRLPSLSIAIAT